MSKVNDFFCGCGGMGLGFKQAGYDTVGAWDFDKWAVESYKHNVDKVVEQADIREMFYFDIPVADVWTFGFPCQDLSNAGKQRGLFEGERSKLFFQVMRLIDETPLEERPSVIMAENVKGLKKFLPVLEEEYTKHGYKMYYTIYNSKYWDVPQNRERYFVVGVRDDIDIEFKFPKQPDDVTSILLDILDEEVDEKFYYPDEKALQIVEQAIANGFDLAETRILRYERTEYAKQIRKQYESGNHYGGGTYSSLGICPTIVTIVSSGGGGGTNNIPKIIEPKIQVIGALDINGHDIIKRVYGPTGLAPTATAVCGGNQQIKVIMPVPEATKKGYAIGEIGDSINISHINSKTRRGRIGKSVAQTLLTGTEQVVIDPKNYRVRRLTPTEYGRLQGFPMDDGWVQVVSDTQAYKQFGNAVTVNVAKVLAEAINTQILEVVHNGNN